MAKTKMESAFARIVAGGLLCTVLYFALQALCAYLVFCGKVGEERIDILVYVCGAASAFFAAWTAKVRDIKECAALLCADGGILLFLTLTACRGFAPGRIVYAFGAFAVGIGFARILKGRHMQKRRNGKQKRRKK